MKDVRRGLLADDVRCWRVKDFRRESLAKGRKPLINGKSKTSADVFHLQPASQ
jgi:hypothetical protein